MHRLSFSFELYKNLMSSFTLSFEISSMCEKNERFLIPPLKYFSDTCTYLRLFLKHCLFFENVNKAFYLYFVGFLAAD